MYSGKMTLTTPSHRTQYLGNAFKEADLDVFAEKVSNCNSVQSLIKIVTQYCKYNYSFTFDIDNSAYTRLSFRDMFDQLYYLIVYKDTGLSQIFVDDLIAELESRGYQVQKVVNSSREFTKYPKNSIKASSCNSIKQVIMDDGEIREYDADTGLEDFMYDFCPDIRDVAGDAYASEEIDEVAADIFRYDIKNNTITYDEICKLAAEYLPYLDEDED